MGSDHYEQSKILETTSVYLGEIERVTLSAVSTCGLSNA